MESKIKLIDEYDNISSLTVITEEDINESYFGFVTVDDSSFVDEEAIFCMTPKQARGLIAFLTKELNKMEEQ